MLTDVQEKLLSSRGYVFVGTRKLDDGEYVAEATKNYSITTAAAHLGESPRIAVRNLIQMVLRK